MDELSDTLTVMGQRIAELGTRAQPSLLHLADATQTFAPVAAAVLRSDAEPEIARCRAFLHVALRTSQLSAIERRSLAARLDDSDELERVT